MLLLWQLRIKIPRMEMIVLPLLLLLLLWPIQPPQVHGFLLAPQSQPPPQQNLLISQLVLPPLAKSTKKWSITTTTTTTTPTTITARIARRAIVQRLYGRRNNIHSNPCKPRPLLVDRRHHLQPLSLSIGSSSGGSSSSGSSSNDHHHHYQAPEHQHQEQQLRRPDDPPHQPQHQHQQSPWPTHAVMLSALPPMLSFVTGSVTRPLYFLWHQFGSLSSGQKLFMVIPFALGFAAGRLRPFWKRYTNILDIPMTFYGPKAPVLVGRAVTVTDGDTIRFLHQPTPWHPSSLETTKTGQNKKPKVSDVALPIRICTIDTPETAKFGKPGQPFGVEAKEALQQFLNHKTVYCRLLQKDQYNRAVAQVFVRSQWLRRPRYVDEYLLKQGLAEVYRGGGAVYGPKGLDSYTAMEQTAKANQVGMWAQGNQRESAADYKKRTKE